MITHTFFEKSDLRNNFTSSIFIILVYTQVFFLTSKNYIILNPAPVGKMPSELYNPTTNYPDTLHLHIEQKEYLLY